MGLTSEVVQSMTDAELEEARNLVGAEYETRRIRNNAQQLMRELADQYAAAMSGADVKNLEHLSPGALIGPGERIIIRGATWVNVSSSFLHPIEAGPKLFPAGWARADGDAGETPAWKPGEKYEAGMLVSYRGGVYKVLAAHTSSGEWPPDWTPSLYALERKEI